MNKQPMKTTTIRRNEIFCNVCWAACSNVVENIRKRHDGRQVGRQAGRKYEMGWDGAGRSGMGQEGDRRAYTGGVKLEGAG